MDVVELIVKDPFLLAVVNQEFAIRWYLGRLDWTQISAENTSGRMLVRKFNGPYTSPTPDIKDILHIFRDWCSIQLAVERETKGVVLEIKPVGLGLTQWLSAAPPQRRLRRGADLIVRHRILPLGVTMVPSTVLVTEVEHRGCGRHGVGGLIVAKGRVALVALLALLALPRAFVRGAYHQTNASNGTHINFERCFGAATLFRDRVLMNIYYRFLHVD